MIPLSCVNCCHNPLQLGSLGTTFGYCTRHEVVLNRPQKTTCGQLLRKDLLRESALRQREIHARSYSETDVVHVAEPKRSAGESGFTELPNGEALRDPVVEEVENYGHLDSKIATMAALHRVAGARAEAARLSLSRSYFANCVSRGGSWTSGVHLLQWTLRQLDEEPEIGAADIRGPIAFSLHGTIRSARWTLIAFRLAFVSDVGTVAASKEEAFGVLATLAGRAVSAAGTDPDKLLRWLGRTRRQWASALPWERYLELRSELRTPDDGA